MRLRISKWVLTGMVLAGGLSTPAKAINLQPGFDTGNLPASQITTDCTNWSKNLNCTKQNQQAVDDVVDQLSTGSATTPASPSGSIQYNNSGTFGGFGLYDPTGSPLGGTAYVDLFNNGNLLMDDSGAASFARGNLTIITDTNNQGILQTYSPLTGNYITIGATNSGSGSGNYWDGYGNLYATYFHGDGSNLTNVPASNPFNQTLNTTDNVSFGSGEVYLSSDGATVSNSGGVTYYIGSNPLGVGSYTNFLDTDDGSASFASSNASINSSGKVFGNNFELISGAVSIGDTSGNLAYIDNSGYLMVAGIASDLNLNGYNINTVSSLNVEYIYDYTGYNYKIDTANNFLNASTGDWQDGLGNTYLTSGNYSSYLSYLTGNGSESPAFNSVETGVIYYTGTLWLTSGGLAQVDQSTGAITAPTATFNGMASGIGPPATIGVSGILYYDTATGLIYLQ